MHRSRIGLVHSCVVDIQTGEHFEKDAKTWE